MLGIFLPISLLGCAANPERPEPVVVTKVEKERVPLALVVPCTKSQIQGKTYEDAIKLAEQRGKDIDACNAQLKDIENWSKQ